MSEQNLPVVQEEKVPAKINSDTFSKTILESAIHQVIESQPFLGNMLQVLQIRVNSAIPTAAVTYDPRIKSFLMYINPQFFTDLNFDARVAVLLHEAYHITNKHLISVFLGPVDKSAAQKYEMFKWNISMDIAINQYIKNLPQQAMKLEMFKKVGGGALEAQKHFEYYYENIDWDQAKKDFGGNSCPQHGDGSGNSPSQGQGGQEKQDAKGEGDGEGQGEGQEKDGDAEGQGSGGGQGQPQGHKHGKGGQPCTCKNHKMATLDDHSVMSEDGQGVSEEEMLKAAKDLFQRTIQKTVFSHSTVPDSVRDFLNEIDKKLSKINYKQMLSRLIRKSLPAMDRVNTWYRPSKRFAYQAPGTKDGYTPKVEIFVDTSGSMSINELNDNLGEIEQILKATNSQVNVTLFHTQCYNTVRFRRGHKIRAEDLKLQSGGTDLQGCFDRLKKVKCDATIILTDGYYGDVEVGKNLPYKTVFVISKNGTTKHPLTRLGDTVQII